MNARLSAWTILLGLTLSLIACGGGGGSSEPPVSMNQPEPPADTQPQTVWSFDTTRLYELEDGESLPGSSYDGSTAVFPILWRNDFNTVHEGRIRNILNPQTRHGVRFTVVEEQLDTGISYTGYGGWLEHVYFELGTVETAPDVYGFHDKGFTLGSGNPVMPRGSATWNGAMVARTEQTFPVYGAARITYQVSSQSVDVLLSSESPLTSDDSRLLNWESIPVAGGRFRHNSGDIDTDYRQIEGGFFGPSAENVTGVFKIDNGQVDGAFGATSN